MNADYAEFDSIRFQYKGGRNVMGMVLRILEKRILLNLGTDYIGKNVDWYAGEDKYFNKAEMTNIEKL